MKVLISDRPAANSVDGFPTEPVYQIAMDLEAYNLFNRLLHAELERQQAREPNPIQVVEAKP